MIAFPNVHRRQRPQFHIVLVPLFLLLLFSSTMAFSLPPVSLQRLTAPTISFIAQHAEKSRRGRKFGGGAIKQIHKEVTGRAADRTVKKIVVEDLTEEEKDIVEQLKSERAAENRTVNVTSKEKNGEGQ